MRTINMLSVKNTISIRVKNFFNNTSVHGLKYIAEPGRSIFERLLWLVVNTGAVYCTFVLFSASLHNYENNGVSFGYNTAYLEWNTTFPAISVCEAQSSDKIFDAGQRIFGPDRNPNMDLFLRDIAFFEGSCSSCKAHCGITFNCSNDFSLLVDQVLSSCNKLIGQCVWDTKPFDCCSKFLPLATETGLCFTINSIHTNSPKSNMKLISNKRSGPGRLTFEAYESINVYIHSPEDVPYLNHPAREKANLEWGNQLTLVFQINEIENQPGVKDVPVDNRNCRFVDENVLTSYKYYSYSACVVDCRVKAMMTLCNCTHHFIPKQQGIQQCDAKGLACLTKYADELRVLKTRSSTDKGVVCECLSSCTEPEYTIVTMDIGSGTEATSIQVSVVMAALPLQRFKRSVVKNTLDLVVDLGGTVSLFLGASFLSLAEVVYLLFLRRDRGHVDNRKSTKKGQIARNKAIPNYKHELFTMY